MRRQLSKEVLPITIRYLIAHQFADKKKIDKGNGVTWTATRFNRLPLPIAPLSEGVPPIGETLTISQVTGVALQWGDKVTLTDVSVTTTMYDLIQQSKSMLGKQLAETRERNVFGVLVGGTQVNYVNSRGSRANLVAGDVLDVTTINRTYADLENLGAPFYNGSMESEQRRSINDGARNANRGVMSFSEHYVAITSPFAEQDLRQNPTIVNAWSYSDVNKLYINEIGYWAGIRYVKSNMTPRWTGIAQVNGTPGSSGTLATGTYYVQVTGTDLLNQYGESQIYQISASISVTGPNGSIALTMPSTSNFTYSVYVGTSATNPTNIGLTTATSPYNTAGLYAGQAVGLAPGQSVTITGLGLYQIPPAAPATGVTVYPTFVFGNQSFAVLELEDVTWTTLFEADKSDPINQLRVIGYKYHEGAVILNQQYMCRIESSVSNSGTFG